MMNFVKQLNHLFAGLLLIVAGLISPSNGVDDRVDNSPLEMLSKVTMIIFSALAIYLLLGLNEKQAGQNEPEKRATDKDF